MAGKKRTKKKPEPALTPFEMTFFGEYVEMHMDLPYSETQESGEERFSISTYLKERGYIMDMDELNFYLGDTPESVSKAIPRHRVFKIEITKEEVIKTAADLILDNFDENKSTEN